VVSTETCDRDNNEDPERRNELERESVSVAADAWLAGVEIELRTLVFVEALIFIEPVRVNALGLSLAVPTGFGFWGLECLVAFTFWTFEALRDRIGECTMTLCAVARLVVSFLKPSLATIRF